MKFKLYISYKVDNFRIINETLDFNTASGRALFLLRMKSQKDVLKYKLF